METTKEFYGKTKLDIMEKASISNFNKNFDRIDEIIAFAKNSNIKKIGLAVCGELPEEGEKLENILKKENFEVFSIDCNYGKDKLSDIKDYKYMTCNPKGQAIYLEKLETQLNIVVGLCVGHDMIFNAESKALVTTLIVKDRKLMHKTIERMMNN